MNLYLCNSAYARERSYVSHTWLHEFVDMQVCTFFCRIPSRFTTKFNFLCSFIEASSEPE